MWIEWYLSLSQSHCSIILKASVADELMVEENAICEKEAFDDPSCLLPSQDVAYNLFSKIFKSQWPFVIVIYYFVILS